MKKRECFFESLNHNAFNEKNSNPFDKFEK